MGNRLGSSGILCVISGRLVTACLTACILLGCNYIAQAAEADNSGKPGIVYIFRIRDSYGTSPVLAPKYPAAIQKCLDDAVNAKASAVIVSIDTAGGPLMPAIEVAQTLSAEDRIPTVACIGTGKGAAYSAGALMALGCSKVYMKTAAVMGAAAPVSGDGSDLAITMKEKITSAASGKIRAVAEKRGRNSAVAAKMVDADLALYECDKNGVKDWVAVQPHDPQPPQGRLIAGRGKLLTLTGKEAMDMKFIDGEYNSNKDVLVALGLSADCQIVPGDAALDRVTQEFERLDAQMKAANKSFVTSLAKIRAISVKMHQANNNRVVATDSYEASRWNTEYEQCQRDMKKESSNAINILTKMKALAQKNNARFDHAFDRFIAALDNEIATLRAYAEY